MPAGKEADGSYEAPLQPPTAAVIATPVTTSIMTMMMTMTTTMTHYFVLLLPTPAWQPSSSSSPLNLSFELSKYMGCMLFMPMRQ